MTAPSLRGEAAALLQRLIRLNTVNPPGNETDAAELLRGYLEESGIQSELYARAPERANLVARIPGRHRDAPRLLLLSHTDTVPASPEEWSVDPWSGELRDGQVWGRGALDMKAQVAAGAVALASLARAGFAPAGDLIFAACADEEVGCGFGLSWLCEAHPEAVRAEWCINEGSGDRIEARGQALYLCATAEKATSPFVVRVRGKSGHASMPAIADNALVKAASVVERLGSFSGSRQVIAEVEAFLKAFLGTVPKPADVGPRVRRLSPVAAHMVEAMLGATVSPTQIAASSCRNVIPGSCEITCDCRLLPGQTQAEVERELRPLLSGEDLELDWGEKLGGSRSPIDTPLWRALEVFVHEIEPAARVVPVLLPGFTDSHYLRAAFDTVAYGFFPMRAMPAHVAAQLIHSADERVDLNDLELGIRCLVRVAEELLA